MKSTLESSTKTFMSTMIGQYVSLLILQFLHYNKNLFHDLVFPYVRVMMQPSDTNLCRYYVCEYMYRVIACFDGSKFKEKVCAHTTATTCSSYCSYSLIRFLYFCSHSLVHWQHRGRKKPRGSFIPQDRKSPINSRTIMQISFRQGY
jgi:hypothetical protein